MGCGRGDLVFKLRKMGYECDGIDFVDLDNGMFVGSILEPIVRNYKTMVCIDVLEHIEVGLEHLVFENFQKSEGQIFSVHNGPAMHGGKDIHINKKSFSEWGQRVGQFLSIDKIIKIHQHQQLFITHAKKQKTRR
ncbi:MAG: hypothetical protein DWQ49_09465 [Bacteroidetes bacterium]|nr:MAG: hypothetical protein DWQ49_09465 [Bacteroidota bacterium]